MRRTLILGTLLLSMLGLAAPVAGGNWADIKPDEAALARSVPSTTTFGFMVLQHGVTPASWVTATVTATNPVTGATIATRAIPEGADGHFVAQLVFPEAGYWTWEVTLAELESDATGGLTVQAPDGTVPTFDLGTISTMMGRMRISITEDLEGSYGALLAEVSTHLDAVLGRLAALEQRLDDQEAMSATVGK